MTPIIQLSTLEEFIAELQAAPDQILDRTVRIKINRIAEQREAVSWLVVVWLTAIQKGDDADYLMEFGKEIGSSKTKDSPVEAKVAGMEAQLKAACELIGLKVRPGKLEVY
jgi:hypothetical protein